MKNINQRMGLTEWLLLILLSILWGGSFFFVGVAVDSLPPLTIVALRVGLAAITLNLIIPAMGLSMPTDWRVWFAFLGMGFLNNVVPFSLIVWGQTHIASGLAAILNATMPLFTVIVAHFLTSDEKLTTSKLVGVLIGFGGVTLMIGPAILSGLGTNTLGQLAILGATISYAFAGVFGRRFQRMGLAPLKTATGQVTASTLILLPIALMVDQPWTFSMPTWNVWGALLGLSLFSTVLAYIIFFRILATAGATNISLVTLLVPVSAILLGALFLDEQLALKHFIGMGLLGIGLVVVDGRLLNLGRSNK